MRASTWAMVRRRTARAAGGDVDAVGLSWMISEAGGVRTVQHGGGTNGQLSMLTMVPARHFAMVILTNANRGLALSREMTRWARAHYLGIETSGPGPLCLPAAELEGYAGRYNAGLNQVEVTVEGERLMLKLTVTPKGRLPRRDSSPFLAPPPIPVVFFERDRIMGMGGDLGGARGEFLRDADGRIAWLRWHGRIAARQE
jgi:hypothetical protein